LISDSLREYKTNPEYKDFSQVITRIEKIIYNQKFTGAASGFLNPNIIARDLGLTDKVESNNKNTNLISIRLILLKKKSVNTARLWKMISDYAVA
jgi:hypothetical protein